MPQQEAARGLFSAVPALTDTSSLPDTYVSVFVCLSVCVCACVHACAFLCGENVPEGGTNEGSVTALAQPYMLVI